MEGLLVLLGIIAAVLFFASPIILIIHSGKLSRLRDTTDQLNRDIFRFDDRLERLQKRVEKLAAQQAQPVPEAAPQPAPALPVVRPAEPVLPAAVPAPEPAVTPAEAPAAKEAKPAPPAIPPPLPTAPRAPILVQAQPRIEPVKAPTPAPKWAAIDWEKFVGTKLINWIGGLLAFLAVVLFVKYSIEKDLISRELRVVLGFLAGIASVVGGVVLKRKAYEVTSQTLCATGIVILYASTFASCSIYHFLGNTPGFLLMVLITVAAFLLAVNMNALVVAILGLAGGFLTPPLLSTGVDRPLGLFTYIAILDIGLVAAAFKRRWHFLIALSALGTVAMQLGWAHKFFEVEKVFIAMAVFLGFSVFYVLAFVAGRRMKQDNRWLDGSAIAMPLVALAFTFFVTSHRALAERPMVIFSFIFGADLCLMALVLLRHRLHQAHMLAGAIAFLLLSVWTVGWLTKELLNWALAGYMVFAVLHTVFPIVLERIRPEAGRLWLGHLFPPLALLLVMIPLLKEVEVSFMVWPVVLLIDLLAIFLAVLTASIVAILGVLVLTVGVTALWLLRIPAELTGLPELLLVIAAFALVFFIVGSFAGEKILAKIQSPPTQPGEKSRLEVPAFLRLTGRPEYLRAQIPAFAVILPFLLLTMAALRLPLRDPSPVYGLALLLAVLALGVAKVTMVDVLVPVALASTLALEYSWHKAHFRPDAPLAPLLWNVAFAALFTAYPFPFRKAWMDRAIPWATAALAGPLHFYLVHRVVKAGYPNEFMGALPAAFSLPMIIGLVFVARSFPLEHARRTGLLAWFGASALFFVTLIFPIQFDRQWITIGWALEGAALLWLFHRVPHRGLPVVGVALLVVAFVRLTLNRAVYHYYERSEVPVFNWFLYAYGITIVCLMAGGRLLATPRNKVLGINAPPILYTLGTILMFWLLNIEISDYFSEGRYVTVRFSGGSLGQDTTYSIAWAVFALGMLVVGVWRKLRAARYAALVLLGITLVKLIFFDLGRLQALYRVAAFMGVAVISIVASVLYQRFFAGLTRSEETPNRPEVKDESSQS